MTPEEQQKRLEQLVSYLNMEFTPDDQQIMLFMNPSEAIDAIRRNEIPGITWTEEDEIKYQRDLLIHSNSDLSNSTKVPFVVEYRKDEYIYTSLLYLEPNGNLAQQLKQDFDIDMLEVTSIQQVEDENV